MYECINVSIVCVYAYYIANELWFKGHLPLASASWRGEGEIFEIPKKKCTYKCVCVYRKHFVVCYVSIL
jgi:hypothetical protein